MDYRPSCLMGCLSGLIMMLAFMFMPGGIIGFFILIMVISFVAGIINGAIQEYNNQNNKK